MYLLARLKPVTLALALLVTAATVSACHADAADRSSADAAQSSPVGLRVAAAASLRSVLEDLAPSFEEKAHTRLVFSFGASGQLQKQIEQGVPVDVFASASPEQVRALISQGQISAASTVTFAGNDLVVLVPKGNPVGIFGPEDLARADRLATGDPETAPHGAKAREWLEGLGAWSSLERRFVFAENAAQTLDYVSRAEVDAGIGFASEARGRTDIETVYTVPRDALEPIRYVAAPVATTSHAKLAEEFVKYLLSDEAQAAFAEAGFTKVAAP